MILFLKALIGASLVIAMSLVAKTKYFFLAGLLPLFPTFALIAHIIVSQNGTDQLKETALFGILSLIPYLVYLLGVYFLSDKLHIFWTLVLSTILWGIVAGILFFLWTNYISTS